LEGTVFFPISTSTQDFKFSHIGHIVVKMGNQHRSSSDTVLLSFLEASFPFMKYPSIYETGSYNHRLPSFTGQQ